MSCLVKSRRPNGTVYIYRSTSVWNSEKGYPIPKRTLVGKLDPTTGQIIPTRKQNRGNIDNIDMQEQSAEDSSSVEAELQNEQDHADTRKVQEMLESYQKWDNGLEVQVHKRLAKAKSLKAAVEKELAEMQKFVMELDTAIRDMQAFDI